MSKQIEVPFCNGTHFDLWYGNNCCECRHIKNCAIEHGLGIAMGTGTISQKLFDRAGGFVNTEVGGWGLMPCNEKNKHKGTKKRRIVSDHPLLFEVQS